MPTVYSAHPKKTKKVSPPAFDATRIPAPVCRTGPLTTFAMRPQNVKFETQSEDEQVVLFLRQHFVVNTGWILITILLILAPSFLLPLLFTVVRLPFTVPVGYIGVGTLFWYLATFGFAFANFLSWFFNIYIVTNERVIDIDFKYLLYKRFSEADIKRIQDLSYTSSGIFSSVFNFGNVYVETAGEEPNLEFDKVPQPDKIVQTIRSLIEASGGGI